MSELITGDSFARITGDTSEHGLPTGTIVAVDRVRDQAEPLTGRVRHIAIVQPGGLAVYVEDLEPFDPLAPTPDSPIVVGGQVVQPQDPAADATGLAEDEAFMAMMRELDALFSGAPQVVSEPSVPLTDTALPEGQEAALFGALLPGVLRETNTAPLQADAEGRFPVDRTDDIAAGRDRLGDPMSLVYSARICPTHGVEGVVVFETTPKGFEMPMHAVPALIAQLQQWIKKNNARIAEQRRNGGN